MMKNYVMSGFVLALCTLASVHGMDSGFRHHGDVTLDDYALALAFQEDAVMIASLLEHQEQEDALFAARYQDEDGEDDHSDFDDVSSSDEGDVQDHERNDELYARRLHEEMNGVYNEAVLEEPGAASARKAQEEQLRRDAEYARRLQEGDALAEEVVPEGKHEVGDDQQELCTICNETQANLKTPCCNNVSICTSCWVTWLQKKNSCPFCIKPNPSNIRLLMK